MADDLIQRLRSFHDHAFPQYRTQFQELVAEQRAVVLQLERLMNYPMVKRRVEHLPRRLPAGVAGREQRHRGDGHGDVQRDRCIARARLICTD